MNPDNFNGPYMGQPWLLPNPSRLSTIESANSQDSFASQVPLPYHLPVNHPGTGYAPSSSGTTTMNQVWGHQGYPDQQHLAFNNSPINPVESYPVPQYGIQPAQNAPVMPPTSYGGYDRFNQQPVAGAYTSNFNYQYRPDYPQTQSSFGSAQYPSSTQGYLHSGQAYTHNDWQNGYDASQIVPQYQPAFGPDGQSLIHNQDRMLSPLDFDHLSMENPATYPAVYGYNGEDRNYNPGKPLGRRNTHGGPRSTAGSNNSRAQNNNGNRQNNGGRPPKRYVSAGGDRSGQYHDPRGSSYFEANPTNAVEQFKTPSGAAAPTIKPIGHGRSTLAQAAFESVSLNRQVEQTPTGKILTAQPTPRTARELGQNTPTPRLRSRRNESVAGAATAFRSDVMKEPPPPFWLGGKRPSITGSSDVSPGTVIKSKVLGASSAQDPFVTGPTDIGTAKKISVTGMSNRFDGETPSRAVIPLHIPRPQLVVGPSPHLAALCPGGQKPTIEVAFDVANMPFVELARTHPNNRFTGLVRISNIPFSCTQPEILAFLGRNAKLIPEIDEPIHIVMERVTSKTMDAYVEFVDINEAVNAVTRYETNRAGGRGGRLGERHVSLEVCGHEHFMQALFPRAVNVIWHGADPQVLDEMDYYSSGFKGFISREELVMLVKHVETPQRSPFSAECPQRPFECLISSVTKYPWHKVQDITIGDRDALFQAAIAICKNLINRIDGGSKDLSVNDRLLKRVQRAVISCNGFTESQKDDFAFLFKMTSIAAGLPPHADHWVVFKTIGAKQHWAPDVILYYIALLREATTSSALVSLAERSAKGQQGSPLSAFGDINIEYPQDVSHMSLAAVGEIEWHAIEALLRKVLQ